MTYRYENLEGEGLGGGGSQKVIHRYEARQRGMGLKKVVSSFRYVLNGPYFLSSLSTHDPN